MKVGDTVKKSRFFLVISLILMGMVASGIQLLVNRRLLAMFIIGLVIVFLSLQLGPRLRPLKNSGLLLGVLLVFLAGFSTVGIWVSVVVSLIAAIIWGRRLMKSQWTITSSGFASQKSYVSVKTTEPTHRYEREQYEWLGTQRIGQDSFEWDDINMSQLVGDTIIDLGNTVLPQQENVVIIRKGIGRVRILVPYGVGVMLQHNAFMGQLTFQGEVHDLKNTTIKCYSDNYDESLKKIKIFSTIGIGNVEVIES